ncbi:M20/M25/M40 family metallo-hydrolase [Undibacterium curvum]|uniref:Carboxypeptidase Q n=1 Tax=Undibacterium curvum TaxID=2762294 RepID=A0ABR7A8V3_9BURK|nr:M20/M25/M40 family metallo-hydrolase [Undibacterium curvum]MBC3933353.1 M20/M25/M40 family metallo-hydrolase [Undibacterium curvum]
MRLPSRLLGCLLLLTLPCGHVLAAEEKTDLELINRLRDEALNHPKAHEHLGVLTDEIGARLTGSAGLKKAADWSQAQLRTWGLQNVHTESFAPFGLGWSYQHASLRMLSPMPLDLLAIPKAWTPGTQGVQHGRAVIARLSSEEDLQKWKGKLSEALVLLDEPVSFKPHLTGDAKRYSIQELEELQKMELEPVVTRRADPQTVQKQQQFQKKLQSFLSAEKVIATLHVSRGEDGTVFVQSGGSYKVGESAQIPALVLASEAYNRLYRLLEKKKSVELEVQVDARFEDEDAQAAVNVIADIPGSDKKDEIVMLGAHLDSWHGATGATDNAAGVAVMMEAVRLLKESGLKPRRTIRLALWGGEEQGLLGSRAYVQQWVAARPESTDPAEKSLPVFLRKSGGPLQVKPQHGKISAYFNLDNGAGKIRGIYAENNVAVKPVFDAWLAPFADLGANTTTLRKTGSTDHVSFDSVGVPGFQFIQDQMDYMTRTHHSNIDVYDKVQKSDLSQAALIVASFVAHAANRNELLPRKPMPKDPPKDAAKDASKEANKDAAKDATENKAESLK